jgi:hypothetical protein
MRDWGSTQNQSQLKSTGKSANQEGWHKSVVGNSALALGTAERGQNSGSTGPSGFFALKGPMLPSRVEMDGFHGTNSSVDS